jgi:hypothetical protein
VLEGCLQIQDVEKLSGHWAAQHTMADAREHLPNRLCEGKYNTCNECRKAVVL